MKLNMKYDKISLIILPLYRNLNGDINIFLQKPDQAID